MYNFKCLDFDLYRKNSMMFDVIIPTNTAFHLDFNVISVFIILTSHRLTNLVFVLLQVSRTGVALPHCIAHHNRETSMSS